MIASQILAEPANLHRYAISMTFKDNLRTALERARIDQSELARRLGVTPSAVNQWVAGTAIPKSARLGQIADMLGVSTERLLTQVNTSAITRIPEPNIRTVPNPPPVPDFQALPRDIPVMGRALGGPEGSFPLDLQQGQIDWVRRPAGLTGVDNVFALYVAGDSMSPWREPGGIIYVSKTRPPQIGSHVVVVLKNGDPGEGSPAYVKKLVRRTADRLELRQYNPDSHMSIEMDRVAEVLRVIEFEEVLGL